MKREIYWVYPHLLLDGGGTKFLYEVAKRLEKKYKITIVCNAGNKKIISNFIKNRIEVKTTSILSANSNFYLAAMPIFLLLDFIAIAKILLKADYIFATLYPSNFLTALFCIFFKKKYFYYCYEPYPYLHNKNFIQSHTYLKKVFITFFSNIYRWTDVIAVKKAQKIFTLNQITKEMIKKTYSVNSIITLMGVDSNHFKTYKSNKIMSIYKNKIIISHSTDYSTMKRTELAIYAIDKVAKVFPNIVLLITSTQPNSPSKKKYIELVKRLRLEKSVVFLGSVSYKELPLYYSASLCYLSCSYDEMLGTTSSNLPVKEALACEVPAIRSSITSEDVEDGISGYLVDTRNPEEVSKKIIYLIRNPIRAREMGRAGRRRILKDYTWDKVAKIISANIS